MSVGVPPGPRFWGEDESVRWVVVAWGAYSYAFLPYRIANVGGKTTGACRRYAPLGARCGYVAMRGVGRGAAGRRGRGSAWWDVPCCGRTGQLNAPMEVRGEMFGGHGVGGAGVSGGRAGGGGAGVSGGRALCAATMLAGWCLLGGVSP